MLVFIYGRPEIGETAGHSCGSVFFPILWLFCTEWLEQMTGLLQRHKPNLDIKPTILGGEKTMHLDSNILLGQGSNARTTSDANVSPKLFPLRFWPLFLGGTVLDQRRFQNHFEISLSE